MSAAAYALLDAVLLGIEAAAYVAGFLAGAYALHYFTHPER